MRRWQWLIGVAAGGIALAWLIAMDTSLAALQTRTRAQHEQMLEDTQSLADLSQSLVQENAERRVEIEALRAELAALRRTPATRRPTAPGGSSSTPASMHRRR